MRWIKGQIARLNGVYAEYLARRYLESQNLTLICKNFHCKSGEIDLIMQDNNELVFVEVKSRQSAQYGSAIDYFTQSKRRKVESAIMHYLLKRKLNPSHCAYRIDLIAFDNNELTWLKSI